MVLQLAPAAAASFTIDLDRVVRADPGSSITLESSATPAGLVGQTCVVDWEADNNSSVHPGNDLQVVSANQVTVAGVEDTPGATVLGDTGLVLAGQVTVSLTMGPDGVFSADGSVSFDCAPPPPVSGCPEQGTQPGVPCQPETTTTSDPCQPVSDGTDPCFQPTTSTTVQIPTTTTPPATTEPISTTVQNPPIPHMPDPTPVPGVPTFTG